LTTVRPWANRDCFWRSDVLEALSSKFGSRLLALAESLELHPAEDRRRLGELNVSVIDNLDVIAPRVAEIKRASGLHTDVLFSQAFADGLLVVDHKPEVPRVVRWLRATGGEGDELVAHIDERHSVAVAPPQLELEDASIPSECFVDVADFKCDVVDSNQACHALRDAP
jgi:hypothetical protein